MTLAGTLRSLWQHAVVKSVACVLWGAALQGSGLEMVSLAVPPDWHYLLVSNTTAQTIRGPDTVFTTSYVNNIYVNAENLRLHSSVHSLSEKQWTHHLYYGNLCVTSVKMVCLTSVRLT